MTAAYRLTPNAREGFLRIVLRVVDGFGLGVANKVVDDLEKAFERLGANPGIGHRREDITRDERVLFWSVGPTLIAYRAHPEWVEILFVERGDLDWERMLTESLE